MLDNARCQMGNRLDPLIVNAKLTIICDFLRVSDVEDGAKEGGIEKRDSG